MLASLGDDGNRWEQVSKAWNSLLGTGCVSPSPGLRGVNTTCFISCCLDLRDFKHTRSLAPV
jgi:hypothetical protein